MPSFLRFARSVSCQDCFVRQELSSRRSTARSIAKESSIVFSFVRGGCFFFELVQHIIHALFRPSPRRPLPSEKKLCQLFSFFSFLVLPPRVIRVA